jgi:hypothetical protein
MPYATVWSIAWVSVRLSTRKVLGVLTLDVALFKYDQRDSDCNQRDREACGIHPPTSVTAPPSMRMTATANKMRSLRGVSPSFMYLTPYSQIVVLAAASTYQRNHVSNAGNPRLRERSRMTPSERLWC